jgi:hypothetical protein
MKSSKSSDEIKQLQLGTTTRPSLVNERLLKVSLSQIQRCGVGLCDVACHVTRALMLAPLPHHGDKICPCGALIPVHRHSRKEK